MPRERFLEAVAATREAIAAGEVYQAVVSQRWTARLGIDPFDVYRALRALNPSPYLFYLETREATILGSSPEMLVRCRGPAGRDAAHRRNGAPRPHARGRRGRWRPRLREDPKERAEHVMLVDLARNDLGRVCEIGTVASRASRRSRSSRTSSTWSRRSAGVCARAPVRPTRSAACFPAGTLTGAPKIRAMELIDELEVARRGIYGGAVGYFDAAGNCDLAIAIRTAVVEKRHLPRPGGRRHRRGLRRREGVRRGRVEGGSALSRRSSSRGRVGSP